MSKRKALWRIAPVLLVASVGLGIVSEGAALGAPRTPNVISFTAKPNNPPYKGAKIHLYGKTSGVSKCKFASTSSIAGLPVTIACPGGNPGIYVTIGKNTGNNIKNIEFSLTAIAASGATQTRSLFIHQLPAPAAITSFSASPTKLPKSGGTVTFKVSVVRANACVYSSDPTVTGLPKAISCSDGNANTTITFPATTNGITQSYDVALSVAGPGGTGFTGSTTIFVAGQTPTVRGFVVSPKTLPDTGGTLTLTEYVTNAQQCDYGYAWKGGQKNPISTQYMPHSQKCSSGKVSYSFLVGPDKSTIAETLTFQLNVLTSSDQVSATSVPTVKEAGVPKT